MTAYLILSELFPFVVFFPFFKVLVPVYIPDSLANSETDHVIIGISVGENQDLTNSSFRSDLASKLVALYVEAKGRKTWRRKRKSGSTSATVSYHSLLLLSVVWRVGSMLCLTKTG